MTLSNLALSGYDPVSYFKEDGPKSGKEDFSTEHKGSTYLFCSEDNLKQFSSTPEKYLPKYGGWCAYSLAHYPEKRGWSQSRIPTSPDRYKIIEGQLYLFSTVAGDALSSWNGYDEKEMINRANDFWNSRIDLARLSEGKPDELNPNARMENLLWERFMGEWKSEGMILVSLEPKKYGDYPPANWTFKFGYNGFCIQDEWVSFNNIGGTWSGPAIRGYDPLKKEWHMTFIPINAGRDAIWLMTGKFNDDLELEGEVKIKDASGREYLQKIFFYNISKESFQWRADRSYDNGATWIENFLDITATRKK